MAGSVVNVENFVRAETDRMFAGLLQATGGVNRWHHFRQPTPLDQQTVIRMNRDTLYSTCVADISAGATLTIPESGDRYLSVMVVNRDHHINHIFHDPGEHRLTVAQFDSDFVVLAARILVDPADAEDLAAVHGLQDRLALQADAARPFEPPEYDKASFEETRDAVLTLAGGLPDTAHAFGRADKVDPIRHLLVTASGWGGMPEYEAFYEFVSPPDPSRRYKVEVPADVPVDAFWSITMYNGDGFMEPNDRDAYNTNSVTAARNDDGSVTVHLGGCEDDLPNCLPTPSGWNCAVRMYRPRQEILDGSWTFPEMEPVD